MDIKTFEKLINSKIDNVSKINFWRKIKVNILIDKIQKAIIDSINIKNIHDEYIIFELKLAEEDYTYYFGADVNREIAERYFNEELSKNGIICNFHHVKYNTKIFDSYYTIMIKFNNPQYVKVLGKKYDNL